MLKTNIKIKASVTLTLIFLVLFFANPFFLIDFDTEPTIVGEWQSEIDEKSILEFAAENTLTRKYDGEITASGTWVFVNECEGETAHDEDFGMLKISFDSEVAQCYVVQGLNGVLTLLALPQGRLLIYDRL